MAFAHEPYMTASTLGTYHSVTLADMAIRLGGITLLMIGVMYAAYFFMKRYPLFKQATHQQLARLTGVDLSFVNPASGYAVAQNTRGAQTQRKPAMRWLALAKTLLRNNLSESANNDGKCKTHTLQTQPQQQIQPIQITHRTLITETQELMVVNVQNQQFLVSVSPEGMTCLSELTLKSTPMDGRAANNNVTQLYGKVKPLPSQSVPVNYAPDAEPDWQLTL